MWPTFSVKIVPILLFHLTGGTVFQTLSVTHASHLPNDIYRTVVYGDSSGRSLQLQCGVSDYEIGHTVSWYKNNKKISEGFALLADGNADKFIDFSRYSIDGEYNLTLSPFYWSTAQQDSGNYECTVHDLNNATAFVYRSGIIAVIIYVIPSNNYPVCVYHDGEFRNHGNMLRYFVGGHLNLLCQSQPGIPPISLLWFQTNNSTPLSIVTQFSTNLIDTPNLSNRLELDLEIKDNETSFSCKLSQANEQDRFCTFGSVTVNNQPNVRVDPEEIVVNSPDQIVKFTCSHTETASNHIQGYRWYIENTLNFGNVSHLHVNYLDMNRTIEIAVSETIKGNIYFIVCEVDYGFNSRNATARLFAGAYANPPPTVTDQERVSTVEGVPSYPGEGVPSHPDRRSRDTLKKGTLVGIIIGVLILFSLVVIPIFVYVYKLRESKQNHHGQEMATQSDYANVISNRQVETTDYANTNSGQMAEKSSRVGEGRVGDDGYANLTVEGCDGSIASMYTSLNLVDTTNRDSNQGMVGDDGYALVNLASREGDAKTEYAHLAPVTDESSDVKSELVGDDGYANLMTRQHEGDSDPSYAQLSHVGERK